MLIEWGSVVNIFKQLGELSNNWPVYVFTSNSRNWEYQTNNFGDKALKIAFGVKKMLDLQDSSILCSLSPSNEYE